VVPATSTLVDQGTRIKQSVAAHPAQVRVLQTVDPATLAALTRNPNDQAAQARAVSELSGVPLASVVRTTTLSATYREELQTAAALSPATQLALAKTPTSARVLQLAVGEIALKLQIAPAAATARLQALAKVPPGDLAFVHVNGPPMQRASAALASVATVPPADLAYLQANTVKVAKAAKDNPGQWQNWWWICFAGQLIFIPLVFLLTGRWSPRKAREDELAHEQAVELEMARLQSERGSAAAHSAS
jgi:hypothetical protein